MSEIKWKQPVDPPALDLMHEFRAHWALENQLRNPQLLSDFDRELHQMIRAFVLEALKPWQQAFADAAMMSTRPIIMPALETDPQVLEYVELWRGQVCGYWYRLTSRSCLSSLWLERNTGMDVSPEHECWQVEWMR